MAAYKVLEAIACLEYALDNKLKDWKPDNIGCKPKKIRAIEYALFTLRQAWM